MGRVASKKRKVLRSRLEKIGHSTSSPYILPRWDLIGRIEIVSQLDDISLLSQVINKMQYLRRKINGGSCKISLEELEKLANDHSELPAVNQPDVPFVVFSRFTDINDFIIIFTTRRLVWSATKAKMHNTDATYKLNLQGLPVLMLAISDNNNHCFPIAVAISARERSQDYADLLRTPVIGAERMRLNTTRPKYVMGDGAVAISSAIEAVYKDTVLRCMCWYHVQSNVKKKMKELNTNSELQLQILRDLQYIQLSSTSPAFFNHFDLMEKKYASNPEGKAVMDYIRESWIDSKLNGWYEGFAPRLPSTNNGLEGNNRRLKKFT